MHQIITQVLKIFITAHLIISHIILIFFNFFFCCFCFVLINKQYSFSQLQYPQKNSLNSFTLVFLCRWAFLLLFPIKLYLFCTVSLFIQLFLSFDTSLPFPEKKLQLFSLNIQVLINNHSKQQVVLDKIERDVIEASGFNKMKKK